MQQGLTANHSYCPIGPVLSLSLMSLYINSLYLFGSDDIFSSIHNSFEVEQNTNPSSSKKSNFRAVSSIRRDFFYHFQVDSTDEVEIQEVEIYS